MCCSKVIRARFSQLTIDVKEFRLEGDGNEDGEFYAKLFVHGGDQMLETDSIVKDKAQNVVRWNQKFEFSASETCCCLGFKVFRARKYLPDNLVGWAECKVEPLFKLMKEAEEESKGGGGGSDDDQPQQKSSQVKNKRILELEDHGETVEVFKGNKKKGSLCISLSLRYNNLAVIGGADGWSFAMRHEDFEMMSTHKIRKESKRAKAFATMLKQLVFCHV